ncbi:unnamed protein product [Thlaspi arvense]|uniref:Uncharacterized protein n=1 Tax=Thlaspi arvense TaxID=13288 RepID=A0AAU9SFT9_THLAR|nr:unnamed protein product [Thlaspi arvense]
MIAVKTCKREPLQVFVHCYAMNHTLVYAIAHDFYLISQLNYQSSFDIRHTDPGWMATDRSTLREDRPEASSLRQAVSISWMTRGLSKGSCKRERSMTGRSMVAEPMLGPSIGRCEGGRMDKEGEDKSVRKWGDSMEGERRK